METRGPRSWENHTWYLKKPSSYQARKIFLHVDVLRNQQGIYRIYGEVGHSAQQLGPFLSRHQQVCLARIVAVVGSYFPGSPFRGSSSRQRGNSARRQDQSRVGMQECELVLKFQRRQLCGEASRAGDSNGGSRLEISRHPPVQGRYQLHVSV